MDHEVDLSVFETRYRNDETGAPAYTPSAWLAVNDRQRCAGCRHGNF